jgi:hypothetical protein
MLNLKSSGAFAPIVNRQDLIQTFGDSFGDWGLLSGFRIQTIVCDSDVEVMYLPKVSCVAMLWSKPCAPRWILGSNQLRMQFLLD